MPENISVAIVAGLPVAVGTLDGSVINPNFAHRIIRGLHWVVEAGETGFHLARCADFDQYPLADRFSSRVFLHADSR